MTLTFSKKILPLPVDIYDGLPKVADVPLGEDLNLITFESSTGTMTMTINEPVDVAFGKRLSQIFDQQTFQLEDFPIGQARDNAEILRREGPRTRHLVIDIKSPNASMFGPFYMPCVPPPAKTTVPVFGPKKPTLTMRIHPENELHFFHHIVSQAAQTSPEKLPLGVFPQAVPGINYAYESVRVELSSSARQKFRARLAEVAYKHPEFLSTIEHIQAYLFEGDHVHFTIPDKDTPDDQISADTAPLTPFEQTLARKKQVDYFSADELDLIHQHVPFYQKSDQTTHFQLGRDGVLRIFDAGNPDLVQMIAHLQRELKIKEVWIAITHTHSDHCEMLPHIAKQLPDIQLNVMYSEAITPQIAGLHLANPIMDSPNVVYQPLKPCHSSEEAPLPVNSVVAFEPDEGSLASHFIKCSGYVYLPESPLDPEALIFFGDNNPIPGDADPEDAFQHLLAYLIKGFDIALANGKKEITGFFDEGHYDVLREHVNVVRLQEAIDQHYMGRGIKDVHIELIREHEKLPQGYTDVIPAYLPTVEDQGMKVAPQHTEPENLHVKGVRFVSKKTTGAL